MGCRERRAFTFPCSGALGGALFSGIRPDCRKTTRGLYFKRLVSRLKPMGGHQTFGARVGGRTKWGSLSASKNVVGEILYYSVQIVFQIFGVSFCSICRTISGKIKTLTEKIFWTVTYTILSSLFLPLFGSVGRCWGGGGSCLVCRFVLHESSGFPKSLFKIWRNARQARIFSLGKAI